ncbi:RICIN domain-containing protein [Haloarcula salina]|uniref:RICIN domain-containing protein n=1 Tax=Haloarcula salina TaxID=1429914 RepID=UPI003C6FE33C
MGTAVLGGKSLAASETITIDGGGSDVWGTEDQCHFYYEQVSGSFEVTVRITDIEDTGDWAKAGILVREGVAPDAKNVMIRYTPDNESSVQWRPDAGGETNSTTQSDIGIGTTDGNWIRLAREDDAIVGYGSTDGSDWTRVCRLPSSRIEFSDETYVGLAVSSFDWGTLCSATFDELSGLSPEENRDIGNVNPAGGVSTSGGSETPTERDTDDGETPTETDSEEGETPTETDSDDGGEPINPGTYGVRNANSGKVLTVENGSEENRASLIQQPYQGKPSQRWTVESLDDGSYRLTPTHSGKAADLNKGREANGANIVQWDWHGSENQRWNIETAGDGAYRIRSVHSGKVMAVSGGSEDDGANVHQMEWRDTASQRWRFESDPTDQETEEPSEPPTSGPSQFGLDSGFADPAPWLDDDVSVRTVTEPTRSAVETAIGGSGPRVVVFETSGTVDLGGSPLKITVDDCWVAGQTAPSPGITFVNGRVQISADNCVLQHIRSRIGPGADSDIQGNDAVNTAYDTHNNVIDHVTASWGTDECLSVGYKTSQTTVTNNLVYEGLYSPYGDRTDHHYATLVGDDAADVTLAGNVWAKCRRRMPRLKTGSSAVVANNLAYFFDGGSNMDGDTEASFVGNTYLGQIDTSDRVFEGGNAYMEDNTVAAPPLDSGTPKYSGNELDSRPLWPDGLDAMSSSDVEAHNLANAGARPADRTANDRRIVTEISERAGNDRLDSPYDYWVADDTDFGGYPDLPENTHSLEVPDSGLREWLAAWATAVEDPNASPP